MNRPNRHPPTLYPNVPTRTAKQTMLPACTTPMTKKNYVMNGKKFVLHPLPEKKELSSCEFTKRYYYLDYFN